PRPRYPTQSPAVTAGLALAREVQREVAMGYGRGYMSSWQRTRQAREENRERERERTRQATVEARARTHPPSPSLSLSPSPFHSPLWEGERGRAEQDSVVDLLSGGSSPALEGLGVLEAGMEATRTLSPLRIPLALPVPPDSLSLSGSDPVTSGLKLHPLSREVSFFRSSPRSASLPSTLEGETVAEIGCVDIDIDIPPTSLPSAEGHESASQTPSSEASQVSHILSCPICLDPFCSGSRGTLSPPDPSDSPLSDVSEDTARLVSDIASGTLSDPVSLVPCGHSFCRGCVDTLYCTSPTLSCPLCKAEVLMAAPNVALKQ
ncbi:hypothetical protein KIPB_012806, partial [Kipferlia bialata]